MAVTSSASFHGMIGRSAAMRALFDEIERFASVDVPVLIRGESGTGKELVARAVQRLSRRRERPFETLKCADLARELLRSELFGHERAPSPGPLPGRRGSCPAWTGARCSWTRSASWQSGSLAGLSRRWNDKATA